MDSINGEAAVEVLYKALLEATKLLCEATNGEGNCVSCPALIPCSRTNRKVESLATYFIEKARG